MHKGQKGEDKFADCGFSGGCSAMYMCTTTCTSITLPGGGEFQISRSHTMIYNHI